MVITTAARAVHVEHVGAAGRRPARACAAVPVAETLQGSRPGPGPPTQSVGAAGEPLQRSAWALWAKLSDFVRITHVTSRKPCLEGVLTLDSRRELGLDVAQNVFRSID